MKTKEIISIVTKSVISTLSQLGIQTEHTPGNMIQGSATHIQIEFVGNLKGYFILETSKEFTCKMANTLLAGMMTVTEVDDMCKSVLGEICNMLAGGICTSLSNVGVISDIKPPYVDIREKGLNPEKAICLKGNTEDDFINTYFLVA